jgi:hypothetical protein
MHFGSGHADGSRSRSGADLGRWALVAARRAAQGPGVAVNAGTFRFELLVDHGGTPTDGRDTNVAGP